MRASLCSFPRNPDVCMRVARACLADLMSAILRCARHALCARCAQCACFARVSRSFSFSYTTLRALCARCACFGRGARVSRSISYTYTRLRTLRALRARRAQF